ncbi:MAG: response regulator, partial [Methylobacter sp.]
SVLSAFGHAGKALQKYELALPMPVNDTPEPVLKLLGDRSRMPSVIAALATQAEGIGMQNFII